MNSFFSIGDRRPPRTLAGAPRAPPAQAESRALWCRPWRRCGERGRSGEGGFGGEGEETEGGFGRSGPITGDMKSP